MEQITIPAWVLVMAVPIGVLGLLNLKAIFLWAYHKADLDTLRAKLWAEGLPRPIFTIAVLFWLAVFLSLFVGLLHLIWTVLLVGFEEDAKEFRFLLAKITALTAVLGAVVALPFTVIRLRITAEQNRHAEDSLFNEKMNAAIADLHAQRQVTIIEDGKRIDVWQDDVVRRSGAIDRLEALTQERPNMVQRVADMLSTYVQELSRGSAVDMSLKSPSNKDSSSSSNGYFQNRSDIEKAVQVLGMLPEISATDGRALRRDLSGTNLRGLNLSGLDFDGANFSFASMDYVQMTRSSLVEAVFNEAKLIDAVFFGANLRGAQFIGAELTEAGFRHANLDLADFSNANATDADFSFTRMVETDMSHSELRSANFDRSMIRMANFFEADLEDVSFAAAVVKNSDFSSTCLKGAILDAETLIGCEFSSNEIDEGTNFGHADTTSAFFHTTDLSNSDLDQTQLDRAFGCRDVDLPKGIQFPKTWLEASIDYDDLHDEWTLYKSDPTAYIPPQDRDDAPSER